jgi:hypothetical protein
MIYVTMGGVTIGLIILVAVLIDWWPGLRPLKKAPARYAARLAPFLIAWCYGVLTILGIGGLLGAASHAALWISNWLGDVALMWGVGGQVQQGASRGVYVPLTATGTALMLILTAVMLAAAKKTQYRRDLKMGAWCGVCLGTSAGVAGFAAVPLAQAANWLGAALYGAVA